MGVVVDEEEIEMAGERIGTPVCIYTLTLYDAFVNSPIVLCLNLYFVDLISRQAHGPEVQGRRLCKSRFRPRSRGGYCEFHFIGTCSLFTAISTVYPSLTLF